jgi:hypothetical protein
MTGSANSRAPDRWVQASSPKASQLVRIVSRHAGNVYNALPASFSAEGQIETVGQQQLHVTNLAEAADSPGIVAADTDAIALDVGGRWVVFLQPAASGSSFAARVVASLGGAMYTIRPQAYTPQGQLTDAPGSSNVSATNLAELTLGGGAALDAGTIVVAIAVPDTATPPASRCVFDHPLFAKYLD